MCFQFYILFFIQFFLSSLSSFSCIWITSKFSHISVGLCMLSAYFFLSLSLCECEHKYSNRRTITTETQRQRKSEKSESDSKNRQCTSQNFAHVIRKFMNKVWFFCVFFFFFCISVSFAKPQRIDNKTFCASEHATSSFVFISNYCMSL